MSSSILRSVSPMSLCLLHSFSEQCFHLIALNGDSWASRHLAKVLCSLFIFKYRSPLRSFLLYSVAVFWVAKCCQFAILNCYEISSGILLQIMVKYPIRMKYSERRAIILTHFLIWSLHFPFRVPIACSLVTRVWSTWSVKFDGTPNTSSGTSTTGTW